LGTFYGHGICDLRNEYKKTENTKKGKAKEETRALD
jgi:hypothetical protein